MKKITIMTSLMMLITAGMPLMGSKNAIPLKRTNGEIVSARLKELQKNQPTKNNDALAKYTADAMLNALNHNRVTTKNQPVLKKKPSKNPTTTNTQPAQNPSTLTKIYKEGERIYNDLHQALYTNKTAKTAYEVPGEIVRTFGGQPKFITGETGSLKSLVLGEKSSLTAEKLALQNNINNINVSVTPSEYSGSLTRSNSIHSNFSDASTNSLLSNSSTFDTQSTSSNASGSINSAKSTSNNSILQNMYNVPKKLLTREKSLSKKSSEKKIDTSINETYNPLFDVQFITPSNFTKSKNSLEDVIEV